MAKALGLASFSPPSEKAYLKTLAEVYNNATSWDTRRQVLSIVADTSSFETIREHVLGLTAYRLGVAHLHRIEHGPAAPVPTQKAPRLRIDERQLDHFLSFVTSPHLVQDLPFGERLLKLSSGVYIKVPNVIRTMIPQRIVKQYTQYCTEVNFKPFSASTMLRILSECSASVRKSLQGLDYFAAEGARAFEELVAIVKDISILMGGGEKWATTLQESLKAGKFYLKRDYKVISIHVYWFDGTDINHNSGFQI